MHLLELGNLVLIAMIGLEVFLQRACKYAFVFTSPDNSPLVM